MALNCFELVELLQLVGYTLWNQPVIIRQACFFNRDFPSFSHHVLIMFPMFPSFSHLLKAKRSLGSSTWETSQLTSSYASYVPGLFHNIFTYIHQLQEHCELLNFPMKKLSQHCQNSLNRQSPVAGAIAGLVRFLPRFDADELIRRAPDFPGTQE